MRASQALATCLSSSETKPLFGDLHFDRKYENLEIWNHVRPPKGALVNINQGLLNCTRESQPVIYNAWLA